MFNVLASLKPLQYVPFFDDFVVIFGWQRSEVMRIGDGSVLGSVRSIKGISVAWLILPPLMSAKLPRNFLIFPHIPPYAHTIFS